MQELVDVASTGKQAKPCCLHCSAELILDDLWGWVHRNGEYLCRDRESGEPLCQPATLI
ncbi:hypothetical protein GCM10010172_78570 [Paractinoplanes ferrugineus]|uniref:Uncharacterized protein n=1 Tax=Paractinoplanes ferrugineus TaxID=113564 RepID=A0A919MHS1_9ACTN|nr:hypothetical protein [Actinoplanes ferrugineus]GIE12930.1 hypothetical protein Afe05nite_47700 [Actinoplanes ferrugineus]